jgi:hypothetical protein
MCLCYLTTIAAAGFQVLRQLPALTYLDISHMMRSSSSSTTGHPAQRQQLLALLQGCTEQQLDQQQQQQHGGPTPAAQQGLLTPSNAAGSSSSSSSSSFFEHLQHLECVDSPLPFSEQLWAALPRLSSLNLSGSGVFRGVGLARLQLLQHLILNGETCY